MKNQRSVLHDLVPSMMGSSGACCSSFLKKVEKIGEIMGRHKRFSRKVLEEKWEEYKQYCDEKTSIKTEFSQKESSFVTGVTKTYITYTIEGFCVYLKLSRQCFYDTYMNDPKYTDIVTRVKEECEVDAREKFEQGIIPTKLAGLWMSKYDDYRQKQEIDMPESKMIVFNVTDPELQELSE